MKLLLSMESHKILQESVNNFEKTLDRELNENIGVMLGSPIKFMKIKKAAKKLQKALVQQSLNDLDMRKKIIFPPDPHDKYLLESGSDPHQNNADPKH